MKMAPYITLGYDPRRDGTGFNLFSVFPNGCFSSYFDICHVKYNSSVITLCHFCLVLLEFTFFTYVR